MWLIQRFCKRLKLPWLLQKHVGTLQRAATYRPAELILALFFKKFREALRKVDRLRLPRKFRICK
jgi:hypothetical protein